METLGLRMLRSAILVVGVTGAMLEAFACSPLGGSPPPCPIVPTDATVVVGTVVPYTLPGGGYPITWSSAAGSFDPSGRLRTEQVGTFRVYADSASVACSVLITVLPADGGGDAGDSSIAPDTDAAGGDDGIGD